VAGDILLDGAATGEKGFFADDYLQVLAGDRVGSCYVGSEDRHGKTSGARVAAECSAVTFYLGLEGGNQCVGGAGESLVKGTC